VSRFVHRRHDGGKPLLYLGVHVRMREHVEFVLADRGEDSRSGSRRPRLLCAPRLVGVALLRLISLNARQQFFFQPSPALLEALNFRLVISFRLVTLKEIDDVAVLVAKRVEGSVRRY
jgi:hypothetical protein